MSHFWTTRQLSRPSSKCCVTQKLQNSNVVYLKTKDPFERKFVWILVFSCPDTSWKYFILSVPSLWRTLEIGHRQSRPVEECSKEKKKKVGGGAGREYPTQDEILGDWRKRELQGKEYCEMHFILQQFARSTELHFSSFLLSFSAWEVRPMRIVKYQKDQ